MRTPLQETAHPHRRLRQNRRTRQNRKLRTKPEAPKNAAKIGENEYPTVAAAIAAADGSESIVLLRDVTENITINKSLTLNLGGFTLSGDANAAVVTISGDKPQVTVKNGTVTGGRNPQNGGGFAIDSAVVQLEDLTITGNEAVGGNGNGAKSAAAVSMRRTQMYPCGLLPCPKTALRKQQ